MPTPRSSRGGHSDLPWPNPAPSKPGHLRVTNVSVQGLFDVFNHSIPMNVSDRITIIHGPNGFGKTVLLKLLNGLLNAHYQELRAYPFRTLRVDFDNHSALQVRKSQPSAKGESLDLTIEYSTRAAKKRAFTVRPRDTQDIRLPLGAIEEIPGLERVGPGTWLYLPTQEELSVQEILERFGEQLPFRMKPIDTSPEWLTEIRDAVNVRLIDTQRLFNFSIVRRTQAYPGQRATMVPAVTTYSEELVSTIKTTLAAYATLSQSLDRTFPTRLVTSRRQADLPLDDLRNELSSLEEKRSRLVEAGLLDKEGELDFNQFQQIDNSNRNVLSVYVQDMRKKLGVFDDISTKIDLFKKIVNSRFLYKELTISSKGQGFKFRTAAGKELRPTSLSSGEQHQLVMFYELLFKVSPNSLVLVDEPELSLHIVWQQEFLKDLIEITRLGHFDVLIATHSPQIIHDRWDLAVELKGSGA
jgi:predicted ATP-binding protein involved in virulence